MNNKTYKNGVLLTLTDEEQEVVNSRITKWENGADGRLVEQTRQARVDEMNVSLKYLSDTDWYISRWTEVQIAIPTQVSTDRALARANVDAIKLELGI